MSPVGGAVGASGATDLPRGPGRKNVVLVVASHDGTRAAIGELLFESGHEVFLASGPEAALQIVVKLARGGVRIDAVISEPEEVLPGTLELVRRLRSDGEELRVALIAGLGMAVTPVLERMTILVRLPFEVDRLLDFVTGVATTAQA